MDHRFLRRSELFASACGPRSPHLLCTFRIYEIVHKKCPSCFSADPRSPLLLCTFRIYRSVHKKRTTAFAEVRIFRLFRFVSCLLLFKYEMYADERQRHPPVFVLLHLEVSLAVHALYSEAFVILEPFCFFFSIL